MFKKLLVVAALCATSFSGYAQLSWTTASQLMINPTQMHGTAVVNGYLYVIAGNTNTIAPPYSSSGDSPYIYYSKINSPGDLGAWTTCTAVLPDGVTAGQPDYAYINRHVNVYNNRIYVTGGNTNGPDFERESILILTPESNGDILNTGVNIQANAGGELIGRFEHTSVIDPATGKLYVLGGGTSPRVATVDVAQIDSVTGAVGTFSVWGNLTAPLGQFPAAILNGKLYAFGGYTGATPGLTTSQYADLGATPPVAFTAATGVLPEGRFDGDVEILNGNIYLIGGTPTGNTTIRGDIYKATVDGSSGDITTWTADSILPTAPDPGDRRMCSTTDGTAIYVPGGRTGSAVLSNQVYVGKVGAGVEDFLLY